MPWRAIAAKVPGSTLRRWNLSADRLGFLALLFFIAGFFLVGDRLQRNFYYLTLLPFLIIWADRSVLKALASTALFKILATWGFYLCLRSLPVESPEPFERVDDFREFTLALSFVVLVGYFTARRANAAAWIGGVALAGAALAAVFSLYLYLVSDLPRLVAIAQGRDILFGATNYGVAVILGVYALSDRGGPLPLRALLWAAVIVVFLGVVLALGRGPLLALAGTFVFMAVLRHRLRDFLVLGAAAAVGGLALVASVDDLSQLVARGDSSRLMIWATALDYVAERPVFGHGMEFPIVYGYDRITGHPITNPHNLFLANQVYGGLFATGLFLLLLIAFLRREGGRVWLGGDATALAIMTFGLLNGLTHGSKIIQNADPSWLYFYLPLGLAIGYVTKQVLQAEDTAEVQN